MNYEIGNPLHTAYIVHEHREAVDINYTYQNMYYMHNFEVL